MKQRRKQRQKQNRPIQTQQRRDEIRTHMAQIEQDDPHYFAQAKANAGIDQSEVKCPECEKPLNIIAVFMPQSVEVRAGKRGQAMIDLRIGRHYYADCTCGHVASFEITARYKD